MKFGINVVFKEIFEGVKTTLNVWGTYFVKYLSLEIIKDTNFVNCWNYSFFNDEFNDAKENTFKKNRIFNKCFQVNVNKSSWIFIYENCTFKHKLQIN